MIMSIIYFLFFLICSPWCIGKDSAFVELPPELCEIVMSPISIATLYSFSFIPSIMYRIESMLLAVTLKKMQVNPSHAVNVPAAQVSSGLMTSL